MSVNDIFVSGFNESPPDYPGGIWILRNQKLIPLYTGYGVFGLSWLQKEGILLGATRSLHTPLIALRKQYVPWIGSRYTPVSIEYRKYIHGRAVHGMWCWADKLYVVAAQGDPDSVLCTNKEFANHYVGKIVISSIKVEPDRLIISNSMVWNPFGCDHHHHYNDILVDAGHLYLSSFSTCNTQRSMIQKGTVTQFRHDLSFERVITDELDAPHSLQIVQDRLYVCSSRSSSIHSISLSDVPAQLKLEYKGINNFVRGLYVTPNNFLIGLSRSAGRTNSSHLSEPINGILEFNRHNGVTRKIDLPSNCDNVYSILSTRSTSTLSH